MTTTFAILTVSDRCYRGEAEDQSGPALRNLLRSYSEDFVVLKEQCVPDEASLIEDQLIKWTTPLSPIDVIITTGGTGFGPRDVTPEATARVIDKLCPAITTAMCVHSIGITPMSMLSRSISGIKNSSLIINLPGSVKGSTECLEVALPCLKHASELLKDNSHSANLAHSKMNLQNNLTLVNSKVTPFKVPDRDRVSHWPAISMDAAFNLVMDSVPVLECIYLPPEKVLGYVTSGEVLATENIPSFRASVKDGYAMNTSSGIGDFKVVTALTAGCSLDGIPSIGLNECVRVNTGGPIPAKTNAVVQVEDTLLVEKDDSGSELVVRILKHAEPNQNIRPIGCDIAIGQVVLPAFTEIRSVEHGILASVVATCVPVFRMPEIAVLSTGNELVPPWEAPKDGTFRDSNMTTLISLLMENGFQAHDMGIARDNPDILLRELRRCLTVADVIITTGGVSMGEKDYLKAILQHDLCADIKFGRVNMKPGMPTTFAVVNYKAKTRYVFALPGNPVSAIVMLYLLVLPALKKMCGHRKPFPTSIMATLDFDVILDERPEYRRTLLDFSNNAGAPTAKSTGLQMSSRLLSWRQANALLVLPSKKDHPNGIINKGQSVIALIVSKV